MRHYNLKQVAEMLGVTYKFVRSLVQKGLLPASNISISTEKVWRVSEKDLQGFLEKNSNKKEN